MNQLRKSQSLRIVGSETPATRQVLPESTTTDRLKLLIHRSVMRSHLYYNAYIWSWGEDDLKGFHPSDDHSKYVTQTPDYWIVTQNGCISQIGHGDPPIDQYTESTNCHYQILIPGLIDSHIHVESTGETKFFIDFADCNTIESVQLKLRQHVDNHSELTWIQGMNWDQTLFGRYPNRHDIDLICKDKPVFLWRACRHIAVANTKALQLANIDLQADGTLERRYNGGCIDMDIHGPTGILREDAVTLILSAMQEKSYDEKKKFILDGLQLCKSQGLTAVQTNDSKAFEIYLDLRDQNLLDIRVFLTPNHDDLNNPNYNVIPFTESENFDDKLSYLAVNRVKLYSDGSLGAETAAIRLLNTSTNTNTSDRTYKGMLMYTDDKLLDLISTARSKGFRLEIHAIGDAAADQVITSIERSGVTSEERPVLTHCQVLGDDLVSRMKNNGIVANIQPSFVPTDMRWVNERMSPSQLVYSYIWRSLMYNGVHVAGGSDAPIESCSPFVGIYDAMFRRSRLDPNDVFIDKERLSLSEALWIYTVGAAYACGAENKLGSIKEGFAADMVLIDPAIIRNPELFASATPTLVISGGRVVHNGFQNTATQNNMALQGPFFPGKGGRIRGFGCKCSIQDLQCFPSTL